MKEMAVKIMAIGERIRELRKVNGVTQCDLAGRLGFSCTGVSFWKRNINIFTVNEIVQLSDIFNQFRKNMYKVRLCDR